MPTPPPVHPEASTSYVLVHHSGRGGFTPRRLTSPVVMIGRVPGNDVVIDSPNVSRRHAKLLVTDLGVTAHDLDSHNGVFVNGKKIRNAPVTPDDLLYIGDVCMRLERADDVYEVGNSTILHTDVSEEEDPQTRSMAALSLAAARCSDAPDDTWSAEVLQICLELVEASVASFIDVQSDGDLQPRSSLPAAATILWPVVQKAVSSLEVQFAADLKETPIVEDLPDDAPRAVMAIPVLLHDPDAPAVQAVLYFSRHVAGPCFNQAQVDALRIVAGVVGLRLARRTGEPTSVGASGVGEALQKISSLEEDLAAALGQSRAAADRVKALEGAAVDAQKRESALAEARKAAQSELDTLRAELDAALARVVDTEARLADARAQRDGDSEAVPGLTRDRDAAMARAASAEGEADALEQQLEALRAELAAARAAAGPHDAFKTALRASVPPVLAERVEALAAGTLPPIPTMQTRPLTVLYVALAQFDAFCERAAPDVVKSALDRFCAAVVDGAGAHGGRVLQVVGHGHLVAFGADGDGALAAVRCALALDAAFPGDESRPGVVAGIHTGSAVGGFFGTADVTAFVEAGTPVVVARAASELAPPGAGGIVVSEAVRALVASAPDLRITRLGPTWIPGVRAAVSLAVVEQGEGGAA